MHQICTVDGNCFKGTAGSWLDRIGQLDRKDKNEINRRLQFFLNISESPSNDWFKNNASPELVEKIYGYLPDVERKELLESLIDDVE